MALGFSSTSFIVGSSRDYLGSVFFPKVSVNLIETQQLFLLQEISAFYKEPQLRKLQGSIELQGGSPIITGVDTNFTHSLVGSGGGTSGDRIRIQNVDYTVSSVNSDTEIQVTPTPPSTFSTTNAYLLDYLWYNRPVSSIDVNSEQLIGEFQNDTGNFFFYNVTYSEDYPLIEKSRNFSIDLLNGQGYSQDPRTGRIIVDEQDNQVVPEQVNLGFSSTEEGVFQEILNFYLKKSKLFSIDATPYKNSDGTWLIRLPYLGYLSEFNNADKIYLARNYSGGFQYFDLKIVSVEEDSTSTYITLKEPNSQILSTVNGSNLSLFEINLVWKELLLTLNLYAEAESEDERLRLTLENFGRKIDEENEYIFRNSDIDEDRTDYRLLNKKRKELLLEGDKIYPYMGSYKALINVLNLFGYHDVQIKEYFLNVDTTSPDNGKFLSVPISSSAEQKKIIKKVWDLLPSKIYKKTSLFGLYYHINVESGSYDDYGTPVMVDGFQFTTEEVLIKLFGLKELLKKEYLPLNARIYDITGEGIYFQRINFETWSDQVQVRVLEIGNPPVVNIYPQPVSYIRDLRRIDSYYVDKFTKLGYEGFLGDVSPEPGITIQDNTISYFSSFTGPTGMNMSYVLMSDPNAPDYIPAYGIKPLTDLYTSYVGAFDNYNLGKWEHRDDNWDTMVPGIHDADFNAKASYYKALPDDPNGTFPTGAPALIETLFELVWQDCDFSWDQSSTLTTFLGNYVIAGATVTISDYSSVGILQRGFTNGEIISIANCPFAGTYTIENITGSSFDIAINFVPTYLSGTLTYSIDISNISASINRLSWDTIGRGEYLDMRVLVEKQGSRSFVYDSGRKPIDEFVTPYYSPIMGLTYNRILDAVILPYEGTYDVSVYIYDITNNFTMQYKKYTAVTPTAQITASYQAQDEFATWESMNILWNQASFDWYYPDRSDSTWEQADLQWDSLQAYAYRNQDLKENKTLVDILAIDRDKASVLIQGSYLDNEYAKAGGYLYFERKANKLEFESIAVASGDINEYFYGGIAGYDIISSQLAATCQLYSRLLIKKNNVHFYTLTASDFFYVDVIEITPGVGIKVTGPAHYISSFFDYQTSTLNDLYFDGGVFAGTYAIEILSVRATGENTLFYLKDAQKELYKLDGYFQPYLTTYDVDYAETHIGKPASSYANVNDVNWDNFSGNSWWADENQANASSGFVISNVAANGTIRIGEYDTFYFSGDGALNMPEAFGLAFACRELNKSTNEGIAKYEYEMYPSVRITLKDSNGNFLYTASDIAVGATVIDLTGTPILNEFDSIWTGNEWHKVASISANLVYLVNPIQVAIDRNYEVLLPYKYHSQIFDMTPKMLSDYYYFIVAKAKSPGLESLNEVIFGNGIEGEWLATPTKSYAYPLKNNLLFEIDNRDLTQDAQYQYWKSNGNAFPVSVYDADDSRALYAGAYHEPFSYSDAVITPYSFVIKRSTSVLFHDDSTILPLKIQRSWKVVDEDSGIVQVEALSDKLQWNFSRLGNFSVYLEVTDRNGNVSRGTKKSFVTVI